MSTRSRPFGSCPNRRTGPVPLLRPPEFASHVRRIARPHRSGWSVALFDAASVHRSRISSADTVLVTLGRPIRSASAARAKLPLSTTVTKTCSCWMKSIPVPSQRPLSRASLASKTSPLSSFKENNNPVLLSGFATVNCLSTAFCALRSIDTFRSMALRRVPRSRSFE